MREKKTLVFPWLQKNMNKLHGGKTQTLSVFWVVIGGNRSFKCLHWEEWARAHPLWKWPASPVLEAWAPTAVGSRAHARLCVWAGALLELRGDCKRGRGERL